MEKLSRILALALFAGMLSACGGGSNGSTLNGELPTVQIDTSAAPDVEAAVADYLTLWGEGDHNAMYAMLSTLSQGAISFEEFDARYTHVEREANLFKIDHEILGTLTNVKTAQVSLRMTLHSAIVGPVPRDTTMDLSLENDEWRVAWGELVVRMSWACSVFARPESSPTCFSSCCSCASVVAVRRPS